MMQLTKYTNFNTVPT